MAKVMERSLLSFAAILALLAACARDAGAQAELAIYNFTTDNSIAPNFVMFNEGGPDITQGVISGNSLEIAYRPGSYPGYGDVGIQFTTNSLYHCILWTSGSIPNGTDNSLALFFNDPFPSNVLVTCLVVEQRGTRAVDLKRTFIEEGVGTLVTLPLDTINGAFNGWEYATLSVHFAPVRTAITDLEVSDGTPAVTLTALAYPGSIVWPRYCERLEDGFAADQEWTNLARYIDVAVSNFAGPASVCWTNLPAPGTNGFYRISGSPYDNATRHLVD
jgi:hypothetical protein